MEMHYLYYSGIIIHLVFFYNFICIYYKFHHVIFHHTESSYLVLYLKFIKMHASFEISFLFRKFQVIFNFLRTFIQIKRQFYHFPNYPLQIQPSKSLSGEKCFLINGCSNSCHIFARHKQIYDIL
jgi:hypothetical protein